MADAKGVAPAQVALAWVHGQGERLGIPVVPIPGTKRVKWLEQNVAALDITLTPTSWPCLTRSATRSSAPATDPARLPPFRRSRPAACMPFMPGTAHLAARGCGEPGRLGE